MKMEMQANKIDDELGYVVLLGTDDRHYSSNANYYIGWASLDGRGITRLTEHVRRLSTPQMDVIEVWGGSIADAAELRRSLKASWVGHGEWFRSTFQFDGFLDAIAADRSAQIQQLQEMEDAWEAEGEAVRVDAAEPDLSEPSVASDPKPSVATRKRRVKSSGGNVAM